MVLIRSTLAAALTFAVAGAHAQNRNFVVQLDGSCMGMKLHVTNGHDISGNTFGCGEAARPFVGKMKPDHVADVTAIGFEGAVLNYRLGLNHHDWVLYETIDGKQEKIGDGLLTQHTVDVTQHEAIAAQ